MEYKIIDVYECCGYYFTDYNFAEFVGRKRGEYGSNVIPTTVKALIIEDTEGTLTYILKWSVPASLNAFNDEEIIKKWNAINKLTVEERKLLGL